MKDLKTTQKRCLELARVIRDGSTGLAFDMDTYVSSCGTTGCVAGQALFMYDRAGFRAARDGRCHSTFERDRATELLGLTEAQRDRLFYNWGHTPESAAVELEHYAKANA